MPRPIPTPVLHVTHVENLPSIVRDGLRPDAAVGGSMSVEVGNRAIKDRRHEREVPVGQRGRVCDYVPFYFAPRSPMLSAIHHGRVSGYAGGTAPLVYLVTSVERLLATGLRPVFTDRNAVLALAQFSDQVTDLDDLVDWPLMRQRYWSNTPDDPERRERRMAECLVPGLVPWERSIGSSPGRRRSPRWLVGPRLAWNTRSPSMSDRTGTSEPWVVVQ